MGAYYLVSEVSTGCFHCDIKLQGCSAVFNSVQFQFCDEQRRPVKVTQIPQFHIYFEFPSA